VNVKRRPIVRHFVFALSVSLTIAAIMNLAVQAGDPRTGKDPAPVKSPPKEKSEGGCHGTSIDFVSSPSDAAKQAKKEEKLVFVLHVSGNFEDPRFT
jgi:hypothetical protein